MLAVPGFSWADTIPGQALVDFESSSDGAVITAAILNSSTKGTIPGTWYTTTNPEQIMGGLGTTSNLKINANASYQLYTPASINGTVYAGSGTRGMRETMASDNAALLTFSSPYPATVSVGFYFRFNGPAINSSPRDLLDFNDSGGNFQIFQIYDQPGNPYFHTHFQSGAGVGNNVSFSRNKWYWVTIFRAAANGTMRINFYDPLNNYALLGASTGKVNSSTAAVRWLWFGCSKYSSGGSQSVDYDNLIINTSGVFPLGPGTGGSLPGNQPPVAVAGASLQSGVAPLAVAFSSAGSSDPEGGVLTYNWVFGDGTSSTTASPSKTYSSAGTYAARLTVSDGVNSVSSANLNITVTAAATNQPPVAVASASPTSGTMPLTVNFSSAGSSDPEGSPLGYNWTFGDGTTSTAASPSKNYPTAGSYVARLVVSDGVRTTASANLTITVSAPGNQPPLAAASATPSNGEAPLAVTFSSAGSSDPNGTPLTYSWNLGDGTTSTAANPGKTYQAEGNYVVRLTVSDGTNSTLSTSIPITVTADVASAPAVASLWPDTAVPGVVDGGPDSAVELGVRFRSDVAGSITGIRFYKASANTGTHVGNLWTSTGTQLATATFTGETASGWQQADFATPVAISANTVYVASYHANGGHYSADLNYYATSGVDNAPLHAPANGVSGANGAYRYGASSAFPNLTWSAANYWVDVAFESSTATVPVNPSTTALPAPWQTADIGSVGVAGTASLSNGIYTVKGAGNLSGTADNFRFVYQLLSGDGEIKVRLNSVENTGTGGRIGVIIRESLTSGSEYAFMGISPGGTFRWQRRSSTGGSTSTTTSTIGTPPNVWMRLVRTGNMLYGYRSTDGTNWTQVNSRSITMAANIYVGLAVASGSSSTLNKATFTNLTVVP